MATIAGTGARMLRQSFYWSVIEPEPGHYDFQLCAKIEADTSRPEWVQTVWGVGYRFSGQGR
jgi:hypothetical protein